MDARDQIPCKQSRSGGTRAKRHPMLLEMHWKKSQEAVGTAEGLELGSGVRPEGDPGAPFLIFSLECFLLPSMHQEGSTPQEERVGWVLPRFAPSRSIRGQKQMHSRSERLGFFWHWMQWCLGDAVVVLGQ